MLHTSRWVTLGVFFDEQRLLSPSQLAHPCDQFRLSIFSKRKCVLIAKMVICTLDMILLKWRTAWLSRFLSLIYEVKIKSRPKWAFAMKPLCEHFFFQKCSVSCYGASFELKLAFSFQNILGTTHILLNNDKGTLWMKLLSSSTKSPFENTFES